MGDELTDDAALDIEQIVQFIVDRGDVLNARRVHRRIHEYIMTVFRSSSSTKSPESDR